MFRRARADAGGTGPLTALLALGALDLVAVGYGTNATAPAELYARRPAVRPHRRRAGSPASSTPGCLAPGEGPAGFDLPALAVPRVLRHAAPPVRRPLWPSRQLRRGVHRSRPTLDGALHGDRDGRPGSAEALRLLQLGGVRHVLFVGPQAPAGLEPVAVLPTPYVCPLQLLRVPDPKPAAYVIERERSVEGDALAAVLISASTRTRRRSCSRDAGTAGPAGRSSRPRRRIRQDRVSHGRRAGSGGGAGRARRAGRHGGVRRWLARADRRPATPVVRANGLFRAVRVGAGRHDVRFRYRPPAVAGAGLSVIGLVAAGWIALASASMEPRRVDA